MFRALWHLPLFLQGKMYWFDIFVFSFVIQIIIAWVYNQSGSVLSAMLLHFVSNVLGAMMFTVFAGGERLTFYALFMSLAMLFALGLVWSSQLKTRRKVAVV
jgi:membrane protease YdiL (CAAX protease family)